MLLADVRRHVLRSLIRPPRLRLSDWIEREIVLPKGTSALPGKVRLWPRQRQIADAISNPEIERLTLVKPVRVGFTTLLTGAMRPMWSMNPRRQIEVLNISLGSILMIHLSPVARQHLSD